MKMTVSELESNNADNKQTSKGSCFCAEKSRIFWSELNSETATAFLATKPPGSYLLRRSVHPSYEYALSQKTTTGIIHIRICRNQTTGLYNMDGFPASSALGFTCVVNLVEAWSRIHREFCLKNMQHPVHVTQPDDVASYVNITEGGVCFHDDRKTEERIRFLVKSFLRRRSFLF